MWVAKFLLFLFVLGYTCFSFVLLLYHLWVSFYQERLTTIVVCFCKYNFKCVHVQSKKIKITKQKEKKKHRKILIRNLIYIIIISTDKSVNQIFTHWNIKPFPFYFGFPSYFCHFLIRQARVETTIFYKICPIYLQWTNSLLWMVEKKSEKRKERRNGRQ